MTEYTTRTPDICRGLSVRLTDPGSWVNVAVRLRAFVPKGRLVTTGDARPCSPRTCLRLLDGFGLTNDGYEVGLPLSGQRLLAYLALSGRPRRSAVSSALWPDADDRQASGSLRSALWRVSKVLPGGVCATSQSLYLSRHLAVDVAELDDWVRRALTYGGDVDDELPSLVVCGNLLPGWYDDWVVSAREQLNQLRLHALDALGKRLMRQCRYSAALNVALTAIRHDPLRESANRLLISIQLAEGNTADATRHARRYSDTLCSQLGIGPSAEFCATLLGRRPHPASSV